jgi:hypothetical protein
MAWMDKHWLRENSERVRAMSRDEVVALLKSAGVLDADGRLAERYRPPSGGEKPASSR